MLSSTQTGLGFRREIADDFFGQTILQPDFIEAAPENWVASEAIGAMFFVASMNAIR